MQHQPVSKNIRDALAKAIDEGEITVTELAAHVDTSRQSLYTFLEGGQVRGDLMDAIAREVGIVTIQDHREWCRMKVERALRQRAEQE